MGFCIICGIINKNIIVAEKTNDAIIWLFLERKRRIPEESSFVHKDSDDAAQPIVAGGYFDDSWLGDSANKSNEVELIGRYREMSLHPEADAAISDITNEAIAGDLDDHPVDIELSNLPVSQSVKNRLREEFENILSLLDFDRRAYDIFRRWYIDGRLFYHKIDPDDPKKGITELRY